MSRLDHRSPINMLLVDSNAEDVSLLQSILARSQLRIAVNIVHTGAEALRLLHKEEPYKQAPRPQLIMLDLALPDMSGLALLKAIKANSIHRSIPIIIFTNSEDEQDMLMGYDEGACAFISKPKDRSEYEFTIERLEAFWFNTAQLPKD